MNKKSSNSKNEKISYENQLELFVKHTPAAVAMFDNEMRYMVVSDRWYTDYGLEGKNIIGKTHYEVFPEIENMNEWKAIHRRCLSGETMKRDEEAFPREDGHTDWIRWEIHPWLKANGSIGGIIMFTEVITRRKEAELALKKEKEKANLYFDVAGTILLVIDKNQAVTQINQRGCEILGCTREKIIGENWFDNFLPQDIAADRKTKFDKIISGELPVAEHFENSVMNKKGELRIISWHNTVLRDDEGNITSTLSSGEDITEKKAAQEEILEKAQILDQVLESVVTTDLEGNVETFNKASEKLFGYKAEEIIGRNVAELYPHDRHDFLIKNIIIPLKNKGYHETEVPLLKKNGDRFYGYLSLTIKRDSEGNPVGMIGSTIDISQRKEAEEELSKLNEELEERVELRTAQYHKAHNDLFESELKFRSLAENTEQALWLRKQDKILYANRAFKKLYAVTEEDIYDNPDTYLTRVVPEDYNRVMTALARIYAEGKTFDEEYRIKLPDGTIRYLHTRGFPFKVDGDDEYHSVGIAEDITELKKLNAELVEAKEKAETANHMKSEFLANMSHEIRTPMNSIIGFADLLYSTVQNERQKSHLRIIRNSGRSLLTLINDILDLSKVEAGKMEIQLEPVNLVKLIKEIEQIFIPKISEKQLEFIIDIEKNIPQHLMLDELRVRQVMFNLVGNAVKFTGSGFIKFSVKKDFEKEDDSKLTLQFSVEDTGIGIPKEEHENIFDTFKQQQGQSMRKFGGSGLGLTITKRLVDMMGGKIGVESTPGEGSLFWVKLSHVNVATTNTLLKEENPIKLENIDFANAKILVADDVSENRRLIAELFYDTDVTIYEALNGKEAVEMCREYLPDIILLDFRMPELTGQQAAHILKHDPQTKHIPIIGVSASGTIRHINDSEMSGLFDEFMIKPIQLNTLIMNLKKYLGNK